MNDGDRYPLRHTPCPCCGSADDGVVELKGGQVVLRCAHCNTYDHCIGKDESGDDVRSIRSRAHIAPSRRSRILARDGGRCVLCGRSPEHGVVLHLGHLLSLHDGEQYGVPVELLDHDANLAVLGEECNNGMSKTSIAMQLLAWRLRIIGELRDE